ncbi:ATP-binding protein [Coxiella burnetii]
METPMHDAIIAALIDWNPWLEGPFPKELMGIERDYPISTFLAIPEIKILEGVRRSGKSTLLYQVVDHALQEGKKVLYINFEDEVLKRYSLSEIYYAYLQRAPVNYLLIDEIQHCIDWVPFIRKFYDRKIFDQIWITGSNTSLITKEYSEMLTGRNIKLLIMPLSFIEYLRFNGLSSIQRPLSREREVEIKRYFDKFLSIGSFPAITLRPVYQRELLINYFEDFLYKDIATRHNVNVSKLKDLAIYLATHSAKIISYRNIAKALNLHPNTVADYISYLKEVFLFDELYKFDYSLKKQYSNDKKIYIIDTGLGNAVSFRLFEDKGRVLETIFYQALKQRKKEIYFHRSHKECDFLIKEDLDIRFAIQVTYSLEDFETKEREIAGLIDAMKTYNLNEGIILTYNEIDRFEIERGNSHFQISVQPLWEWLLK